MLVENLSHDAANEAYCLIMAYLREERIAANYDGEKLKEFAKFLADILKNPNNFKVEVLLDEEDVVIEDTGDSKPLKV